MKSLAAWVVLLGISLMALPAAALSHLQANRIHLLNAGSCSRPTGPMWITLGNGQPPPGFINVDAPGFDQIGALLTGSQPGTPESVLMAHEPGCAVIASFYENAQALGAWVVPPDKLLQLISILRSNG